MNVKQKKKHTVEIGQRIRLLRKALNLSAEELAGQCGVSQSAISQVETGKSKGPSAETLAALIKNTPVNPVWLLTGEGPMRGPYVRDYVLVTRIEGPDQAPEKRPEFFEVVADLPKGQAVTVVTKEEMALLHQLLTVLRTGDEDIKSAIKGNLLMAVRLCKFLNPRFGDIIILDRRVEQLPREAWPEGRPQDERKASTGRKGGA